jgi:hypothetical protein
MMPTERRSIATVVFAALIFWAGLELVADAEEVRVKVDAARIVRKVDARFFGLNAVMWDSSCDTPETLSALRELGACALRLPGGGAADDYHWALNRNGTNAWTCVICHRYPVSLSGWENEASLLQSAAQWTVDAASVRRQLKTYFGAANTKVEVLCTENNSIGEKTGKQTTSLVNGLYLADSFGQLAQTEFNSFLWWNLRNGQDHNSNNRPSLYGWRQYGDHGIMSGNDTRYPTFYTFKLLKYFARGGDSIVSASSSHKLLSIYAARRTDGTLALLVINKSPKATLQVDLSIAGFQPQSGRLVYSYGIPQDEAGRNGKGSPDIEQTTFAGAAADFSRPFLPYSATVLVLSPLRGN